NGILYIRGWFWFATSANLFAGIECRWWEEEKVKGFLYNGL
ncbi:hypothetical protein A2U01_0115810, partial [Trifolium medium]|nr:hypothetical protein [Trifolium medium]